MPLETPYPYEREKLAAYIRELLAQRLEPILDDMRAEVRRELGAEFEEMRKEIEEIRNFRRSMRWLMGGAPQP